MANDVIGFPHNATGAILYALIRNDSGEIWETVSPAFEAYLTANLGSYEIALTEQGTASQFYTFVFPSAITAGVYSVAVYIGADTGTSPAAEGDIVVAEGEVEWDGARVVDNVDLSGALLQTTIATLASQVSFTLTDGPPDNAVFDRSFMVVEQDGTPGKIALGLIDNYTGGTKTITLSNDPGIFTMAIGDKVKIYPVTPAMPDRLPGTFTGMPLIGINLPQAPPDTPGGLPISDAGGLDLDAALSLAMQRAVDAIVLGTVGSSSTVTNIVTSSLTPSAVDSNQFRGRIVTFAQATTTTSLRGQSTNVIASTTGGELTVTALSTAPVSGDIFTIQ